jgi:dTDP-3,4-didehydro-2,6-dideoxy-alpha-D-glucose 3-reductase
MRSSFGFPLFPDKENIRYQAELGGGALFDAGAYPIKVSQLMLGEDLKVEGASLWKDPALGVDIWGGGFLKQRNGSLFSEIAFGFDHFYQCNIELWGSKGKLYTNRIFTARPDFTPKIIVETNDGSEAISVEPDHHFRNFLTNFSVLVRGEKEKEFEYMQNVNQARLLEEFKKVAIG